MRSIDRIYHPYWDWEEVAHNMWGSVSEKSEFLEIAIGFTGDAEIYGAYMVKVTKQWAISCEHNLSNKSQNRKAWIGHAACALAFRCPEDIVRKAWGYLTKDQQDQANEKANNAIDLWEIERCRKKV